jgi:hypothetical protein
MRFSAEDGGRCGPDDWGTLPPVHVVVEAHATGGPTDFVIEIEGKRVLILEPKHPQFREWMSDLISALTEAMNDPCDVLSLTQEHFSAEEERLTGLALCRVYPENAPSRLVKDMARPEVDNAFDGIPAGATQVWNPPRVRTEWRLPGADVDLRPWRGRTDAELFWGDLGKVMCFDEELPSK